MKYTLDLFKEIGMTGCKLAETPKDPSHRLGVKLKGVPIDKERYQWLVGRLIYLSHTQPDIVYVVSIVSQFMTHP